MQPNLLTTLNNQNSTLQNASNSIINNPVQANDFPTIADPNNGSIAGATPQGSSPQTVAPVTSGNKGNWFTDLLPTIGGVGGTVLGALIPGLGETGAGEIGGGAAGSALGQTISDMLTGKQAGADVLGSAASGAVGGGVGKLGEAAVGGVGGLLANKGAQAVADAGTATADAAKLVTAKNTTSLFGKDAANGIDQNFNKANDFASGIGQNITADPAAAKANIDAMVNHFGNARQEALQNSGNVNLAGAVDENGNQAAPSIQDVLMNSFNKTSDNGTTTNLADQLGGFGTKTAALSDGSTASRFVSSLAPAGAKTPASDLLGQVKIAIAPLFKEGGLDSAGSAPATTVQDSLSAVNKLRSSAFNALQKAGTDASTAENVPSLQAKLDYISNVKTGLEGMLYGRPEFSSALGDAVAKPNGLLDNLNSLGPQGTAMAAKSEQVDPLTGGQDFNKNFSDLLNAQKVLEPAAAKFTSPTSDFARLQATPTATGVDAAGNPIINALASSKNPHVSLAGKAGQVISGATGGPQGAVKLGNLLQRFPAKAVLGITGPQLLANSVNAQGPAGTGTAVGQGGQVLNAQPSQGGLDSLLNNQSPEAQVLRLDLINAMHPSVGQTSTGLTSGDQAEASKLNQVSSAQSELANLTNMLNQAGGAQGPVGGILSSLGSRFTGGPASQYNTQAQQLVNQIDAATGAHIQAPSIFNNQQTANDILTQLQQAIQSAGGAGGQTSL